MSLTGDTAMDAEHREALREAIMREPAYRLAHEDLEFLSQDDLRPLRLQMELTKPERELRKQGIGSTVVVFGSARILSREDAEAHVAAVERRAAGGQPDPQRADDEAVARRRIGQARYYEEARKFARMVSSHAGRTVRGAHARADGKDAAHPHRAGGQ